MFYTKELKLQKAIDAKKVATLYKSKKLDKKLLLTANDGYESFIDRAIEKGCLDQVAKRFDRRSPLTKEELLSMEGRFLTGSLFQKAISYGQLEALHKICDPKIALTRDDVQSAGFMNNHSVLHALAKTGQLKSLPLFLGEDVHFPKEDFLQPDYCNDTPLSLAAEHDSLRQAVALTGETAPFSKEDFTAIAPGEIEEILGGFDPIYEQPLKECSALHTAVINQNLPKMVSNMGEIGITVRSQDFFGNIEALSPDERKTLLTETAQYKKDESIADQVPYDQFKEAGFDAAYTLSQIKKYVPSATEEDWYKDEYAQMLIAAKSTLSPKANRR